MFRSKPLAARALCVAAFSFASADIATAQTSSPSSTDQTQAASSNPPQSPSTSSSRPGYAPGQRGRRVNANRQARIERNIRDAYTHRWEVAGGGSYLRFHPGPTLLHINEVGFFVSGTRQWSPRWGVVGEVRGNFGNAKIPNELARNQIFRPQISHYNFMGGAQYRFLGAERYTVSLVGEGGVTLSKFGGDAKGLPSQTIGLWKDSDYNPTFSGSVNLDSNIYNNLAFRLQPTYVATTFGSTVQNSWGVNAGFVYRFGRQ